MADLVTVKIRDLIETQQVMTTDYMVVEKDTGTFKCQARYLKGATGLTPNVQVGNTTTLAPGQLATVTQIGNTENPIFDFGIPQGVQGQIGPQGPKGDTPSIAPLQTEIDNRFNALTSQQQGDSEVIEARGYYPALKARLDAINDDLIKYNDQTIVTHTTENNFSSINATKNGYLDNILLEGKTLVVDSNNNVVIPGTSGSSLKSVGDEVNEIKLYSVNGSKNNFNGYYKLGTINGLTGQEEASSSRIISDFIKINTNQNYSWLFEGDPNGFIFCYDDNKQFNNNTINIKTFKTKLMTNVSFIRFRIDSTDLKLKTTLLNSNIIPSNYIDYIENTKKVLYKDIDGTWKKPTLRQWDSIEKHNDGKYYYHKRSEIRTYQSGDENNSNVITDKNNTVYKIANEILYECTPLDLMSYDTQTNYSIECGPIYPKTTLKVNSYLGNVVSILKDKVSYLENYITDGLASLLSGGMKGLAEFLYPQDFVDNVDDPTTLEEIK